MSGRIAALSLLLSLIAVSGRAEELFTADSKTLGSSKMDIVITEIERRPRVSVLDIKINNVGSSVGSSFFLLCSIRKLGLLRGGYHHIVKLEQFPKRNQMTVAFLERQDENISSFGPEFAKLPSGTDAVDLEPFAEICGVQK